MVRTGWVHFGMVVLGVLLVVAGVAVGIGATEYEITREEAAGEMEAVTEEMDRYGGLSRYGELSGDAQRIAEGTIEGTQYRFDTGDERALAWGDGRVVQYDERYHVITRSLVVDWGSPAGIGALALAIGGVLSLFEAIRRHHFPGYRPSIGST